MVMFNRTRVRTTRVHDGKLFIDLYAWRPCKTGQTITAIRNLQDVRTITDITPVGKYLPGMFKLSDVLLKTVKYDMSSIFAKVMQDDGREGCPSAIIRGNYADGYTFSPSATDLDVIPVSSDLIYKLALRAYAGISKPDVDFGENLAEFGSLLKMIHSPIKGLADILKSCLLNKKLKKRRPWHEAANMWLAKRYGWDPLISDLKQLANDYFNGPKTYKAGQIRTESSREVIESVTKHSRVRRYLYGTICIDVEGQTEDRRTDQVRIYYKIDDPGMYEATKRGTSIFNAASLAYNLIPLSFVLDWWSNLGDYIASVMPNPYVTVLGCTHSQKRSVKQICWPVLAYLESLPQYATSCAATMAETKSIYFREVIGLPEGWMTPKLDINLESVKHTIDAISLTIQRVPIRKRS